jgi:predicted RNase H-like HicB family nuclease
MTPDDQIRIVLYWSDADQAFIAEVPGLPGRRRNQAGSTRECRGDLFIDEWLETARELETNLNSPKQLQPSPKRT